MGGWGSFSTEGTPAPLPHVEPPLLCRGRVTPERAGYRGPAPTEMNMLKTTEKSLEGKLLAFGGGDEGGAHSGLRSTLRQILFSIDLFLSYRTDSTDSRTI